MNRYRYPTFQRPRVFKYSGEFFWSFGGLNLEQMMSYQVEQTWCDVFFAHVEDWPIPEDYRSSRVPNLDDRFMYVSDGYYQCRTMNPLQVFEYLTNQRHIFMLDL